MWGGDAALENRRRRPHLAAHLRPAADAIDRAIAEPYPDQIMSGSGEGCIDRLSVERSLSFRGCGRSWATSRLTDGQQIAALAVDP